MKLYKVVITFYWSVNETLECGHQMKAIGRYFSVVLFIMLYNVTLTIDSVDKILTCDHSNESY